MKDKSPNNKTISGADRDRIEQWLTEHSEGAEYDDLYWIDGDDEAISYCFECAEKRVAEIRKERSDADVCVDGGWGCEADGAESCVMCGKNLNCSFTDYGSQVELDILLENGFVLLDPYCCHTLKTIIGCHGWQEWRETCKDDESRRFYRKLNRLCRRILRKIDKEQGKELK